MPSLAIPATLQDSLMARLDRLGTAKEVAQLGATLGREFTYELLQAVSPLDEAALQQELDQVSRGRAALSARAATAGDLSLQACPGSRHRLSIVAEEQTPAVSSTDCPGVGGAISGDQRDPTRAAGASLHRGRACIAQAIPYWQQAGQTSRPALGQCGSDQSSHQGLELLKTLPDTPERAQQELTLQLALGAPLMATKGYGCPGSGKSLHPGTRAVPAGGRDPSALPGAVGLWVFYFVRGGVTDGARTGRAALRLAQSVQDPALLLEAHYALGETLFCLGELASARTHLEQGLPSTTPSSTAPMLLSMDRTLGVGCHRYAAWVLWFLGYPDQALTKKP